MKPLCIDLFCGLGGWADGFLAEGYTVVGFDIERHDYGSGGYPGQMVLQDVLTLHGSQFRNAECIVASPPCQGYSYRAMPWKRAKAMPPPSNELFDACFRLQREASEAAGRHIPLVVENVKGAQPWVGSAAWHYGSFYLWGDVPALMPSTLTRKVTHQRAHNLPDGVGATSWFHGNTKHEERADGLKVPGIKLSQVGFNVAAAQRYRDGIKQEGLSGPAWFDKGDASLPSRSNSRKAASAQIAKIPFPLASWIARVYKPAA